MKSGFGRAECLSTRSFAAITTARRSRRSTRCSRPVKNVILEIEVQGAMKVRSHYPEGVYIFVLPPSMQELRKRLTERGTEAPEVVESGLGTAAWEFTHIQKYNYVLLNDDVEKAVCRLEAIIDAEHCRTERNINFIEEVCHS